MISKRAQMVDSSGIRKVFELAAKIENPVNFSIGQPDFDVPGQLKEKAIEAISKGLNRYTLTQGNESLRKKVLETIETTRKRKYPENGVIITSGVSGGLFLALLSIIDPGDEVIILDPYFVMYKHLVNLIGGKPVIVETYPDFKVPFESLRAAITGKTKAIIINSPCNPSGYVYGADDINSVVRAASERNILVITDEIYDGFVFDGKFESISSYYDNVMILGGFSKTYAMTGWRLGYAAGHPDIISQMIKLQQYTFVCAPSPFQYAAEFALEMDMEEYRLSYRKKRDLIYEGLKDNFKIVKPGGAFYIFPELKAGSVTDFVEAAIGRKVLIIPGNVFSERNANFRISFAAADDDIKRGIDILNKTAEEFYKK